MILDCFAGASKGFFDSSVGSEFANRSAEYKKTAPKPSAPRRSSSGGGFFDKSVGSEFANRSESPKKAAPAPRHSSPAKSSSGGGFFDSSVGSQFANRSESPKKAAPRQTTPTRASSSGKLFTLPMFHSHMCAGNCAHAISKRAGTRFVVNVQADCLQAALNSLIIGGIL